MICHPNLLHCFFFFPPRGTEGFYDPIRRHMGLHVPSILWMKTTSPTFHCTLSWLEGGLPAP